MNFWSTEEADKNLFLQFLSYIWKCKIFQAISENHENLTVVGVDYGVVYDKLFQKWRWEIIFDDEIIFHDICYRHSNIHFFLFSIKSSVVIQQFILRKIINSRRPLRNCVILLNNYRQELLTLIKYMLTKTCWEDS